MTLALDVAEIVRLYDQHRSITVVAEITGICRETIRLRLKAAGVERRKKGRPAVGPLMRRTLIVSRAAEWAADLSDEQIRTVTDTLNLELRRRAKRCATHQMLSQDDSVCRISPNSRQAETL